MLAAWKEGNDKHSVLKKTSLPTEVHIVKAMFFPVVIYRYESWTVKKAEP